jgi:hypothetical protein
MAASFARTPLHVRLAVAELQHTAEIHGWTHFVTTQISTPSRRALLNSDAV